VIRRSLARRIAALLVPLVLAGCGAGLMPTVHSEAERLTLARTLHDRGDYGTAAELLSLYVTNNGGAADVDEALFLLGDCHLRNKDWVAASGDFERLLRDYPESDSSAAARFGLAEADFAQSRSADFDQEFTLKALGEWQRYARDFPEHWRVGEAQQRILACRTRLADKLIRTARLYLQLRHIEPARVYFRRVTTEYADTVWLAEAELGLALCDARDGRREEAITQFKGIEERYAGRPVAQRAARERKRLERRS